MNPDPLPARYADRGLTDLRRTPGNERAIDWCQMWVDGEVQRSLGLVLVGDPGTGKTAIAAALARDALDADMTVGFMTAMNFRTGLTRQMDLMEIIRKATRLDEEDDVLIEYQARHDLYWEFAHETQLLVLDDLGRESASKSARFIEDHIDNLLRNRGDNALATVITTNLTKANRAQRYGEALESYLHGVCDFIQVDGGDWRRGEG